MEQHNDISEELRLLSKVVGGIGRTTPYQVPSGYFEGFSAGVLSRTRTRTLESPENIPLWEQIGKNQAYSVPGGYFEAFAEKLLNRIKTGQTEESNSREELASLSPLLSRITKKPPFEAPEGYFSELAAGIVSGVKALDFVNDELEESPSLLTGLKNRPTYRAPDGYFDHFADTVLIKATQKPTTFAEPISINRNKRKSWIAYAAAAAVTGLILIAGWPALQKTGSTGSPDIQKSLTKVSDQEILNYIDNQTISIPQAEAATNGSTATLDINESDIKSMLGDVPDDELNEYLEEHGG
ncbi:hypothetical protein ACX0G9_29165 [Flavitalea flava]